MTSIYLPIYDGRLFFIYSHWTLLLSFFFNYFYFFPVKQNWGSSPATCLKAASVLWLHFFPVESPVQFPQYLCFSELCCAGYVSVIGRTDSLWQIQWHCSAQVCVSSQTVGWKLSDGSAVVLQDGLLIICFSQLALDQLVDFLLFLF